LRIPEASWAYVEFESGWGAKKKHSNVISIDLNASLKIWVNLVAKNLQNSQYHNNKM
jgi:hypothetical protein